MGRGNDMLRSFSLRDRQRSWCRVDERLNDESRRCPVDGCGKKPDGVSRYCSVHKHRLRRNGHPTLALWIKNPDDYNAVVKIGEWMRKALTRDEADHRAWLRVEAAIERVGYDPRLHLDTITMARRDKHFKNSFKAKVVIAAKLAKVDAAHILAGYLGMAGLILRFNDVSMNKKQLLHCTHKAGGRTVVRYARTVTRDPDSGKTYRWKPSYGVVTMIGEFIEAEIAREFGEGWWREAQVQAAVAWPEGVEGPPKNVYEAPHKSHPRKPKESGKAAGDNAEEDKA